MAKTEIDRRTSGPTYGETHTHPIARADSIGTSRTASGLAGAAGFAGRMVTTLVGGGLLIAGGLLDWVSPATAGEDLSWRAFYRASALDGGASFLTSAGGILVLIGILAVAGIANFSGILTRLMGALGLTGFALFGVTMGRSSVSSFPSDVGLGAWLVLAGSLVAIVAGFVASRRKLILQP
ncbi:MAG: hypothetical protein ACRDH6_08600 [Actinomycetota bacterium]